MQDQATEVDVYFSKALQVIDHHWGPFHPMHISIYGVMAQLLISQAKYDDAKYLYQASILCCVRTLGPNHIQTGEVHMDFGKLYLLMDERQESLQHFIEAYLIYESYFKGQSLQQAEAALKIADLLEDQKRMKEALVYAKFASEAYRLCYEQINTTTIRVIWQELTISYALKDPNTFTLANSLINKLIERELTLNEPDDSLDDIKVLAIATLIMEMTRNESDSNKGCLKQFCDKLLFNKKLEETRMNNESIIPSLVEYHLDKVNPQLVMTVKKIKFSWQQRDQLLKWFE